MYLLCTLFTKSVIQVADIPVRSLAFFVTIILSNFLKVIVFVLVYYDNNYVGDCRQQERYLN